MNVDLVNAMAAFAPSLANHAQLKRTIGAHGGKLTAQLHGGHVLMMDGVRAFSTGSARALLELWVGNARQRIKETNNGR